MKILTISQHYPPQRFIGSELYDHDLHKFLIKLGHIVQVITGESPNADTWTHEGVEVNPRVVNQPDVILTHIDYRQKAHYYKRKLKSSAPMIGIGHNLQTQTLTAAKLFKWDGIVTNSIYMSTLIETKAPTVTLIPPIPKIWEGDTPDENILLIGASKEKGIDILIKLAEALPDKQFTVIEGGWGQQKETPLPNIKRLPHQKNLTPLYKKATHLLVPSLFESWAMVASEAQSKGLNIITYSDLEGVKENIGSAGILVDRDDDIEAWVEAINKPLRREENIKQQKHNRLLHQQQLKEIEKFILSITGLSA